MLSDNLIPKTTHGESIVFYQKMKGDYYRYIAEFTDGDKKSAAAENARKSYDEAQKVQYRSSAILSRITGIMTRMILAVLSS